MTVSNNTLLSKSKHDIISHAMTIAGVKKRSVALAPEDYSIASTQLEAMLAHWQAMGLNQHLSTIVTLILEPSTQEYLLGATAHCSEKVYQTTLTAAAVAGATVITVASVSGVAVNNTIGVWLGQAWQWTTIAGVSGLNITLSTALTSNVDNGVAVYHYVKKIERPLRVKDAYRQLSGCNVPINILSRDEFYSLNTTAKGDVISVYYNPNRDVYGSLYTYPVASVATPQTLLLHVQRPAYLPQANSDTLDLPQEWMLAVYYNLAAECGVAWGVSGDNMVRIENKAAEYYNQIRAFDREQDAILTYEVM